MVSHADIAQGDGEKHSELYFNIVKRASQPANTVLRRKYTQYRHTLRLTGVYDG